jgi:predicted phage-related endonuclease
MGYSRFRTAYDVYLEKTKQLTPEKKKDKWTQAGNLMEKPILNWFRHRTKLKLCSAGPTLQRSVKDTPITVHLDAYDLLNGNPVEAKSEGLYGPIIEPWGEPGTNEVPEYTYLQTHAQMMATDTDLAHVPAFLGGSGFCYYFVNRDDKIAKLIREEAIKFWEENVLKKVPPPGTPTYKVATRIRYMEGKPVELPRDLVALWIAQEESAKNAKKIVESTKAKILAKLGGIEVGTWAGGYVTNFEQNRDGYEVAPTKFRVLRHPKKKPDSVKGA